MRSDSACTPAALPFAPALPTLMIQPILFSCLFVVCTLSIAIGVPGNATALRLLAK
jgi:hypothetical protein